MIIALASVPFTSNIEKMLEYIKESIINASNNKARVICFPEACIPGMRGIGVEICETEESELKEALLKVQGYAEKYCINVILPMEYYIHGKRMNVAFFMNDKGSIQGMQTKNQLDPSEDNLYCPGDQRLIFVIDNVKFGIVICHEGFRYPETVRWAARRDAKIIFHPFCAGSNKTGKMLEKWCDSDNPYYEKAMICRAIENNVYFASVNYSFKYQDAATCVVSPDGNLVSSLKYGVYDILICDLDIDKATNVLANRCRIDLYK